MSTLCCLSAHFSLEHFHFALFLSRVRLRLRFTTRKSDIVTNKCVWRQIGSSTPMDTWICCYIHLCHCKTSYQHSTFPCASIVYLACDSFYFLRNKCQCASIRVQFGWFVVWHRNIWNAQKLKRCLLSLTNLTHASDVMCKILEAKKALKIKAIHNVVYIFPFHFVNQKCFL